MSDDRNLPDLRRIRGWTKTWRSPQGTEISVELPFDEVRVQHFRNLDANEVFKVWMEESRRFDGSSTNWSSTTAG